MGSRHCEERSDAAIQESQDRSGLLRFARNDGRSIADVVQNPH
jgi:hypothetical protein